MYLPTFIYFPTFFLPQVSTISRKVLRSNRQPGDDSAILIYGILGLLKSTLLSFHYQEKEQGVFFSNAYILD